MVRIKFADAEGGTTTAITLIAGYGLPLEAPMAINALAQYAEQRDGYFDCSRGSPISRPWP